MAREGWSNDDGRRIPDQLPPCPWSSGRYLHRRRDVGEGAAPALSNSARALDIGDDLALGGDRMKPAPFEYQVPATLREAIDLLVSDPEATVIAGGQSLMPVLAFRLAAPSTLVDLRRVSGLGNIAIGESGVRLGARVRWRDIEDDRRLVTAHPLLREAIAHVAHYQIRNRGTVGGSLAHADPACRRCDNQRRSLPSCTCRSGPWIAAGPFRNSPSGKVTSRSPVSPSFMTRIRAAEFTTPMSVSSVPAIGRSG